MYSVSVQNIRFPVVTVFFDHHDTIFLHSNGLYHTPLSAERLCCRPKAYAWHPRALRT